MKRFVTILALMLTTGVALFWWINQRPPAPRASGLLPASTVMLLAFPDFAHTRAAFPQSAAATIWREPSIQTYAADIHQALIKMVGLPLDVFFLNLTEGQLFVAIASLDTPTGVPFKAIAGMDVSGHYLETRVALAYRESRFRAWNREAHFAAHTHLGVKYREWSFSPQFRLYHAFLNSLLVWTNDELLLHETIERFTGQTKSSLALNLRYRDTLAGLRTSPEFIAYADIAKLARRWPMIRALSDADTVALGSTFLDGQVRDVGYSIRAAPRDPLPVLNHFQTIVMTSPNTVLYRVGTTDWETGYHNFAEAILKSGNASLFASAAQFERSLERHGIRPREDLFRFIGPETAIIANWRPGARFPDIALAAELRQPDQSRLRIDVGMTALKEAVVPPSESLPWDTVTFHGETIRTLRLRTSVVAPSYFTTDKLFVLTSTPDYARELIGQIKEPVPTLATKNNYQQIIRHLPANAAANGYADLRAIVPPLLARVGDGLRQRPSRFLRPDTLLNAGIAARHLAPYASATVSGRRDDTTITISTFGKPATVILGAWLASKAILPHLVPLNPTPPTTSSNTNVPPLPPGNPTAPLQTPSP